MVAMVRNEDLLNSTNKNADNALSRALCETFEKLKLKNLILFLSKVAKS